MPSPRLAIFDLGNVVFRIDFGQTFRHWSSVSGVDVGVLASRFTFGETFERFERNDISSEQFADRICEELGMTVAFDDFVLGWTSIYGDEITEVTELLPPLSRRLTIAALTNTNELHRLAWPGRYHEVLRAFDRVFASSLIGARKPEEAAFRHVLEHYEVSPGEAIFFDDWLPNIEAARRLGITAYHVVNVETVQSALAELGLSETTGR